MCTETVQVCTGDSNSGPGDSAGVLVGECPTKFSWSGQQCSEGNSFFGRKMKTKSFKLRSQFESWGL